MVTRTAAYVGVLVGSLLGACGGQKTEGAAQGDRIQGSESSQPDHNAQSEQYRPSDSGGPAGNEPSAGGVIGRGGELPFAAATAGTSASEPGSAPSSAGEEASNGKGSEGEASSPSQPGAAEEGRRVVPS